MNNDTDVKAYADQLRSYAEHFVQRDWDYTRNLDGLKHIRYRDDSTGYNRIDRRIRRALSASLGLRRGPLSILAPRGVRARWFAFEVRVRKDHHRPDGILDGGGIITHWEETGEYLQYVQPSVGSLLADWMEAEPDSPHAVRIASEMRRINDRYGERLSADAKS